MIKAWDIQGSFHRWGLQVGIHVDHDDPSVTLHLPFVTMCFGRCKQPGFGGGAYSFTLRDDPRDEEQSE